MHRRIPNTLRIEWLKSKPPFVSLPEQGNENIIFSLSKWELNKQLARLQSHACTLRHEGINTSYLISYSDLKSSQNESSNKIAVSNTTWSRPPLAVSYGPLYWT